VTDLSRSRLRWLALVNPHRSTGRTHLYFRRVLGRRGGCLLIIGLLWILVAYSVIEMPTPNGRPSAPHERFPVDFRVAMWSIGGFLAMVFAWFRKPGDDAWGFYALLVPPLERALSWAWVVLVNILPAGWQWPGEPYPQMGSALAGFGAWGSVTLLILIISGWREAPLTSEVPGATN
jgi:hypothetical protein